MPDTGRARLRCSNSSTEFRTANERQFPLSKRIYSQRKKKKTPSKLWVRINLKGEDRADRASKPAPFAEKKNAKSAAPANSMVPSVDVRCLVEGSATRPPRLRPWRQAIRCTLLAWRVRPNS